MLNFDSLTLKYFFSENYDFIFGSVVQKIQLPSRYEIILNLRNISKSENRKLYININPKYPHICFVDENSLKKRDIAIPKNPPMFCMQLRKYINGSKIKDFRYIEYERILEFYFDYFDEIGSLTRLCLAFEFMGKYSNIILYNASTKIIIGSIHNVSAQKSSIREVFGGAKYIYPPLKNKLDILNCSYSTFFEIAKDKCIDEINNNFYYFSKPLLESIFLKEDKLENVFYFLQKLQALDEKTFMISFWGNGNSISNAIDNYFSNVMFEEILSTKKNYLIKNLKGETKRLKRNLENKPDNKKMEKYKLIGDYIMMNLYQNNLDKVVVEGVEVLLDDKLSLSENAQKYYNLYKKAKSEFEHIQKRYNEAEEKFNYLESILLNIELAESFDEINQILDELSEIGLIKTQIKKQDKIKLEPVIFDGYEIYIGKNNKQNDYIISKMASGDDLWFHGLNFPSSHVILKVKNTEKTPTKEVMEYCAGLVKQNSKAKNSGKTSIIMTKRKNLKKPPNTYLGYVTYKNEVEIVI